MKTQPINPATFDGAKFRTRHSLGVDDFFVRENVVHYPNSLPDNAHDPALDAPDPLPARPDASFAALKAGGGTAADVLAVTKWLIQTGRIG